MVQFVPMPVFKAIRHHVKLRRIGQEMTDDGRKKLISFGDRALNLYECGNKNGVHTIISLTSWDDGEAQIGWRKMTSDLESENQLIFLDRAGYGLSNDSAQDMTAAQVISDDRAALQNAGVEAPYLLLAHSMGGNTRPIGRANLRTKASRSRSYTTRTGGICSQDAVRQIHGHNAGKRAGACILHDKQGNWLRFGSE